MAQDVVLGTPATEPVMEPELAGAQLDAGDAPVFAPVLTTADLRRAARLLEAIVTGTMCSSVEELEVRTL